jgi:hypothetical protein
VEAKAAVRGRDLVGGLDPAQQLEGLRGLGQRVIDDPSVGVRD